MIGSPGFLLCKMLKVLMFSARSLLVFQYGSLPYSFFILIMSNLCPKLEYSVGQFFEDARKATRDVLNNGRVPIVTGGTGLYLRWYVLVLCNASFCIYLSK